MTYQQIKRRPRTSSISITTRMDTQEVFELINPILEYIGVKFRFLNISDQRKGQNLIVKNPCHVLLTHHLRPATLLGKHVYVSTTRNLCDDKMVERYLLYCKGKYVRSWAARQCNACCI